MQKYTPHFFGIRHLSPGGAYHLLKFLDEVKPTAVLIEGLSDANSQIEYFTAPGTKPPFAVLAYTEELPIKTLLYPMAEYSPEYQALVWANNNGVLAEFIDLPSDVFLTLEYLRTGDIGDSEVQPQGESIYEKWAEAAGEEDHESYWERNFEHNLSTDSYRLGVYEFGKGLRELSKESPSHMAQNLVREAYMRKKIRETIDKGHSAQKVVVVTGAYHSSVLGPELPPMTDEEFESLPRVKTKLTLMPYSYYKLSSRSGYGAGNSAPQYFEYMWNCMRRNDLKRLPALYLSGIAGSMRESGTHRSSAEVIEGVRLANAVSAMRGGTAPVLKDLRDAAVVCLGYGELSAVSEAVARIEIGTGIGSLPEGVSRTSIQDDFYRELKRLKLDKYRSAVAMDIELDLRENRRVQSKDAAYLDLNRSFFLHRLRVLGVSFQKYKPRAQQSATWAEAWTLRWTPEAEIELVESTLKGETIELASAYALKDMLEKCERVEEASAVIREACMCGLVDAMEMARKELQRLAVDSGAFNEIAAAAKDLAIVISYGDIRKFDTSHFIPLLSQLFLRGALLLVEAARCDNEAAKSVIESINSLNSISLEHYNLVNEETWLEELKKLASLDDRNPKLSGYACSILLERNLMDNDRLSAEVTRRLSPGIEADIGAGWFEGLSLRNKYALLARTALWEQISLYVESLEDDGFKRALVFLRRAFSSFGPSEKRNVCEILGEIWGVGGEEASDILNRELEEEEQKVLEDINEFDFGDI
ncbi:MAG TPA: DUF5682 family protein [Pseudobacteroides sp.]|nr:DUF5682 family protein [Pseudobacteroides sp.]